MERALYEGHLTAVLAGLDEALGRARFDGIVFHAGSERLQHADDQAVPFRPTPHFARLAPIPGPDHLAVYRPGRPLRVIRVVHEDYWYEPPPGDRWLDEHPWADVLDVTTVASAGKAAELARGPGVLAYVGNDPAVAARLGIGPGAVEPAALMAGLDWARAYKTPYEVAAVRAAGARAAAGHLAVRDALGAGASERALHDAYLRATGHLEHQTPYGGIVGWDAHAAVLHYQSKSAAAPDPGRVLLIDAGATVLGYASDITRTWLRGDGAHPVFRALLDGMDALQRRLVAAVGPGVGYVDLHRQATREIGALLVETGLLRCSLHDALERRLVFPFFPHGLGHHLGLQVHDVGGKLAGPDGSVVPSPADAPHLRTTRPLEPGHLVTIEPGLYFIPMLLAQHRGDPAFDWPLIDALVGHGGIRIEDDVLVTADGQEDLTRPLVPGP